MFQLVWATRFPLSLGKLALTMRLFVLGLIAYCSSVTSAAELPQQPNFRVPTEARQCTPQCTREIDEATRVFEKWAADVTWNVNPANPDDVLLRLRSLILAREDIHRQLESLLGLRTQFVSQDPGPGRLATIQQYLRIAAHTIDLSGRLRYLLRDAIDNATYDLGPHPKHLNQLIDLLTEHRVAIGAAVMTYALFDPPADSGLQPFSLDERKRILNLIHVTRDYALLPDLARFIKQDDVAPELVVLAAQAIEQIGLPQDPSPDDRPQDIPPPPITAEQLREILADVNAAELDDRLQASRVGLLNWLTRRVKFGVEDDHFRLGHFEVRPGDWLLMRNPSPYNCFTDLSPGLFTHVGVVAVEEGNDGIRRFVIADLPERGDHVPSTNVEAYLVRTLHYFFVRHKDADVAKKMGEVARMLIGNKTQFDLTFQTDRVLALKGKPLENQRLNTYCAGFLLVCAQETTAPRSDFFPIPEHPPGERFLKNLSKLGISIGDNFVSPTGPVFSPKLELVGRRRPMYSPDREVKEAIYDHFGYLMIHEDLQPTQNTFQVLRTKVAGLSQSNPWLARALAKANNVSEHMDLKAAAKTAAVIETLDEIADESMNGFLAARQALYAPQPGVLEKQGVDDSEIRRIKKYQERHARILKRLVEGQVSPRTARIDLVNYYVQRGKQQLRNRFFQSQE